MYNARHRVTMDLDPYPTLLRAEASANSLEPFAAAAPERQQETI
jgi:hypothetical protein